MVCALGEWDGYVGEVLRHIKFKYDHSEIRRELEEHLDDSRDALLSQGLTPEEATAKAVHYMGEPQVVGKALDALHHPLLGWIWRLSRLVCVLLCMVSFFPLLGIVFSGITLPFILPYKETYSQADAVYTVDIDEYIKDYDLHFYVSDATYFSDGTMQIRYRTWMNPFAPCDKQPGGISTCGDEDGNDYTNSNRGSSNIYCYSRICQIQDFPPDAQQLVLEYNYITGASLTVTLPQGVIS